MKTSFATSGSKGVAIHSHSAALRVVAHNLGEERRGREGKPESRNGLLSQVGVGLLPVPDKHQPFLLYYGNATHKM